MELEGKIDKSALHTFFRFIGCKTHDVYSLSKKFYFKTPEEKQHEVLLDTEEFIAVVQNFLSEASYCISKATLVYARNVISQRENICILLSGTSGSGKSTLASLLASRLGISTVVSTDHLRQIQRCFFSKENNSVLWSSSYQVPDFDVISGFKKHCQLLEPSLENLIHTYCQRKQSLIIEGVQLSPEFCSRMSHRYREIIPFIVCISSEDKHLERFAIRTKHMTLEPRENKYVKNFHNIRKIQDLLCQEAKLYSIPILDNSNVDRSLTVLHKTILHNVIAESKNLIESFNHVQEEGLQSKQALELIRTKAMQRHNSTNSKINP